MNTRDALLRAVIADPDDDTPRLAYADYLDETGGPADAARAELIRHQIATARLPDDHPDVSERVAEGVRLTDRHKADWFGWVRRKDNLPYPRRGFLDSWFCGTDPDHRADLADAFRDEPITSATLGPDAADLGGLSAWPELARVRDLKLWPKQPGGGDVAAFLASPHLTGLRTFEYMGRRGTRVPLADAVGVLAGRPQFAGLRSLSLQAAGVGGVGGAGAWALSRSATLKHLTALALSHCDLGLTGADELLASPVVAGLTSLDLGGNARTAAAGGGFAAALAGSPHLGRLERLALDETAVTDLAAAHLARANWPALRHLELVPHDRNDSSAPTGLPTMTVGGWEALASAGWFGGLEELDLSGHPVGDAGARVLAAAGLTRLRRLTLMQVGLTPVGLRLLVDAYSTQLDRLQLYGNPLGDVGAEVVAAAAWPRMVPRPGRSGHDVGLFLGGCSISGRGQKALRRSKTIPADIPTLFLGMD